MQRILEPELMELPAQALAYAEADFESAHQAFIHLFQEKFPDQTISNEVLDLGCGPCDVTRRFALAYPQAVLHAVDGADAMLQQAARLNRQQGLEQRIRLIRSRLPEPHLPQQHYHCIISNSLLHHLHDPHVLWECVKEHAKPFAWVFVMDLIRPADRESAMAIVNRYAATEPTILRDDFFHSLCAAFTADEVQSQLDEHALPQLNVEVVSDRHMIIYGSV